MATGRDAALDALTACRRLDAWSDGSLKAVSRGLEPREAALAARLAYGVLQNRALLDYYLGCFCAQPFQKLEPFVRDVLRLGAYQVLFMDRVPDSAAVDQAVETVKRRKHQRASGMVNAVLRRLSREKDHLPALPEGTVQERLSLQYSHPAWLTGRLLDLLGPEEAEAFLRLDNGSVPTAIQRNPLRCTPEELVSSLEAAGAKLTPHPLLPDCWYMTGGGDVQAMEAFQKGFFQVQDPAAKAAVLAAGPRPGDRVLDVCAAPGGKTFAAAMAMEDKGEIVACDIHPHKMALIEKGAAGPHLRERRPGRRQNKPGGVERALRPGALRRALLRARHHPQEAGHPLQGPRRPLGPPGGAEGHPGQRRPVREARRDAPLCHLHRPAGGE